MRHLALITSLLFSSLASSQTLEDVIYKKDGSILRGQLVEQDFENNRYKIQLQGGSVFVVVKDEISKITKEAKIQPTSITSSASTSVSTSESVSTPVVPQPVPETRFIPLNSPVPFVADYQNTLFIGRHFHEISTPEDSIYSYFSQDEVTRNQNFRGFRLGYQRAHSKHLASIYAVEFGKLDSVTIEDDKNDVVYESLAFEDTRYLGLNGSVIISTNLQKGWQFFVGGGVFHNRYFRDSSDFDAYGTQLDLGLGYSWYNCQLLMRVDTDLTNSLDEEDADLFNLSIDFGYNF